MTVELIPGLGIVKDEQLHDLIDLHYGGDGMYRVGHDGVKRIVTPKDKKTELIIYSDKTLVYVKSAMGYPAIYPLHSATFDAPAEVVLMDLDGTSVHSEAFWMWTIEQTTAKLINDNAFKLEKCDEPHVAGHSVSEHLQYCIKKYAADKTVEEAREIYFKIVREEMQEIVEGRGHPESFQPAPGLKDFLLELKDRKIKIGLVTSGLYEKAWPEIVAAFRTLNMGNPLDFYDAIITAGQAFGNEQTGTLGELSPKPHPWLYAETARVGLGINPERKNKVVGIEDSGAGVMSVRLAGFACIGINGGNIIDSGYRPLLHSMCNDFNEILKVITGE